MRFANPFSRQSSTAQTPAAIPYDPELITVLVARQETLLELLHTVRDAAKQRRYDDIPPLLATLKTGLDDYATLKEERCLIYLEQNLKEEAGRTVVREMRGNATLTQRGLYAFLGHYLHLPINDANLKRFGRELDEMTREFRERLEREAMTLHLLYQPANQGS
ncbi:MAG TPA: hypothetical protein VGH91_05960 [Gammaproteobacteria bacterium]|jgi:hypothetical protein